MTTRPLTKRDQVWERKRAEFFARKAKNGGGKSRSPTARPPQGQLGVAGGPPSPLSQQLQQQGTDRQNVFDFQRENPSYAQQSASGTARAPQQGGYGEQYGNQSSRQPGSY